MFLGDKVVTVLLVEDSLTDARLVEIRLSQADSRFGRFTVECAHTLAAALRRMAANRIDVVILDLHLPDSEGLNTFKKLHALVRQVPIVILTGYEDFDLAIEAIQLGADDYLSKNSLEANTLARTIRFALERRQWRSLHEEVRLAGRVQQLLLPRVAPRLAGLDIAGACRPTESIAGDYFDYLLFPDGSLGVVVADVVGHGLGPSLIMAGTRRMLRDLVETYDDVGEILTIANRKLCDDVEAGMFVTLFLGRIDRDGRSLTYAAAGHPGLLVDAEGKTTMLQTTGIPLGLLDSATIRCAEPVTLRPSDTLVLLTDGIEEARSPDDERFGLSRALDVVRSCRLSSAGQIVDELLTTASQFCAPGSPQDDMTAVVIKVTERRAAGEAEMKS